MNDDSMVSKPRKVIKLVRETIGGPVRVRTGIRAGEIDPRSGGTNSRGSAGPGQAPTGGSGVGGVPTTH